MDLAIHVYLECFHDTFIPPNMKTYPLVNFESLVSDINLASLLLLLGNQYSVAHSSRCISNT